MNRIFFTATIIILLINTTTAQQKKAVDPRTTDNTIIPISNADLGTFPYFNTLPNFHPTDSSTIEQNRTYFFDGKTYFIVDGQVSSQNLNVKDDTKKLPSEFQLVQEFDKLVATLGGKKVYEGKLPDEQLKKLANQDLVELGSKKQVAPSSFYGVVEYVIKTPKKEVWVQLVPGTIASKFYTLLIVERQNQLITTNINKENLILISLEKGEKAVANFDFAPDDSVLMTQSKDELLNIVGVFQAHPEWKIKLEVNNAPVGKPDYLLTLTEKRAKAIRDELLALGVKPGAVDAEGFGDTKPLASNDTEKGRQKNTRVEISKF